MNAVTKAVLRFAAANLDGRAANARRQVAAGNGPEEGRIRGDGAAFAFQVAADYLRGLIVGADKLPPIKELLAKYGRDSR